MTAHRPFVRDMAVAPLLDTFLASAVATVLVVRAYLAATGFPQVGSARSGIHIAHALWGGLLLMVALVIALALLPRAWRWVVAATGGIGFGLFIDELGKFITEDVDYFFQPTAAIVYVVFAVMYLVFREISTHRPLGSQEALANAATLLREAAFRPLTARDRDRVVDLLDRSDSANPLVIPLREAADAMALAPEPEPGRVLRSVEWALGVYRRSTEKRLFPAVVSTAAVAVAATSAVYVVGFVTGLGLFPDPDPRWFFKAVPLASVALSAALVGFGVARMRHDRVAAYRAFDRALLVNLFVTQIFLFAHNEFWAGFGFVVAFALFLTVRLGLHAELRGAS